MFILSLFITNLFIFLYNNLLIFLNSKWPIEASNEFIRIGAVPEPFEIPLSIILSFVLVLVLFFLHLKTPDKASGMNKYLKISVFIFLLLAFIANLGTYPMARDAFPVPIHETSLTYLLFFTVSMLTAGFIIIQSHILTPIIKKNRYLLAGIYLISIIFIAFITLDPLFNIYGHDYSYFFGPVWEIVHGKTIYTQTPSQYGFLSVLILALLHKLNIVNALYLPVIVWLFYIVEYSLFFYIIYKISKSLPMTIIGLFSLIIINNLSPYHLPSMAPQIGPLRWLPLIMGAFVLLWYKKITSWPFIFFISLSSLWVLDSGIYLILAYLATLFLLMLSKQISLKKFLLSVLFLVLTVIGIFTVINLLHLLFGYLPISPLLIFSKIKQYGSAGFGMLPMDTKTYYWLVPLIYFASIIYFFKKSVKEQVAENLDYRQNSTQLLLFSANISLFASIYFVGRSHPHNLFHISIFPLLNLLILVSLIFKNKFSNSLYLIAFIFLIAFPLYQRQEAITNNLKLKFKAYQSGAIFIRAWWYGLNNYYRREIEMIKKNLPDNNIVILSPDDTYLFYLVDKENLLYDNSQFTILTQKDMDYSLQDVYKTCPKKIVTECTLFNQCENRKPFTELAGFNIQPLLLSNIEKNCKTKYAPKQCTDKLCLVERTESNE